MDLSKAEANKHQMLRDSRTFGTYTCWGCGINENDVNAHLLESSQCAQPLTA